MFPTSPRVMMIVTSSRIPRGPGVTLTSKGVKRVVQPRLRPPRGFWDIVVVGALPWNAPSEAKRKNGVLLLVHPAFAFAPGDDVRERRVWHPRHFCPDRERPSGRRISIARLEPQSDPHHHAVRAQSLSGHTTCFLWRLLAPDSGAWRRSVERPRQVFQQHDRPDPALHRRDAQEGEAGIRTGNRAGGTGPVVS